MPFVEIHKYRIVLADQSRGQEIESLITEQYVAKFGTEGTKNPKEISIQLKSNFKFIINLFESTIEEKLSASFFMFVHLNYENLSNLHWDQLNGFNPEPYGVNKSNLAIHGRVYGIIIEQFVKYKLYHVDSIDTEIHKYEKEYIKHLELLLYLGICIYNGKEFVAHNNLFPGCMELIILDNLLNIRFDSYYKLISNYAHSDSAKHLPYHNLIGIIDGLIEVLNCEFQIDFYSAIMAICQTGFGTDFDYFSLDESLEQIATGIGSHVRDLKIFYSGLTLSKKNVLTTEDTVLRSQKNERFLYRPILSLIINEKKVYKTSQATVFESVRAMSVSAFGYGYYPKEWRVSKKVSKYFGELMNSNDLILQDKICEIIKENKRCFDYSINSLITDNKSCNLNIVKNEPGEIDIIYLDIMRNEVKIYLCECKNNRYRDDLHNWTRDYSNFINKYEDQLTRKITWAKSNKQNILIHFEKKYNIKDKSLRNIPTKVIGLFLLNSATIYMYDGIYTVFTIKSFEEFIKGKFERQYFIIKNGNEKKVEYPYFRNLGYER